MGLTQIPRVLASCAKGYYKRRSMTAPKPLDGIGRENPYKYQARVGILDVDIFGHMNNASHFVHAELARWEMAAYTSFLDVCRQEKIIFVATGAAIRFRKEIGPLWKRFDVDTCVGSLDNRNIWFYQTFRNPEKEGGRILAQILLQAVLVKDRTVLDPQVFLEEKGGINSEIISQLVESNHDEFMEKKRNRFEELETALRESASTDDETKS